MSFINQFATYFTEQERQSELYKLWSAIGMNTEKAILEEQNKLNAEMTDIGAFSEDTLRSWLGFMLKKIPYRSSATSLVTVNPVGTVTGSVVIPAGTELSTNDGVTYTQLEEVTLLTGSTRSFLTVQGKLTTETGTYNQIIKVQAVNPDLDYLTVTVGGVEIPEVSFETSYDNLLYRGSWLPQNMTGETFGGNPKLHDTIYADDKNEIRGAYYLCKASGSAQFSEGGEVIEFNQGDAVVFDGNNWTKSFASNGITPTQFENSYAYPSNGYYAYYQDGFLYIKVYKGTDVTDPEGLEYVVTYIRSDGVQGEVSENTLGYSAQYVDSNENIIELSVQNAASSQGVNEPSKGKLSMMLKQRLFTGINISSIPEYTTWFRAQPEVGDCLVLSDYERWLRDDKQSLVITGMVNAYLVDKDGNDIDADVFSKVLLPRLEPYKDIAVITMSNPTVVRNVLCFDYYEASNDAAFHSYLMTVAKQFYDTEFLMTVNGSLFNDLDLAKVVQTIQENTEFSSVGLTLTGYHYMDYEFDTSKTADFSTYVGEKVGSGFYYFEYDEKIAGEQGDHHRLRFREIVSTSNDDVASILDDNGFTVGTRNGTTLVFNITSNTVPTEIMNGNLACYWGMADPGLLTIGLGTGIRKLKATDSIFINGETLEGVSL